MLFKLNNCKSVKGFVLIGLLTLLTSCGSSAALESYVGPDPKLIEKSAKSQSQQAKIDNNQTGDRQNADSVLPANFPASFPVYPQAQLKESKLGKDKASGMLTWDSSDPEKEIADYYEAELMANDWTIVKPFTFNSQRKFARAIAVKDETRVDLSLFAASTKDENKTQLSLIYQAIEPKVADSKVNSTFNSSKQPDRRQSQSPAKKSAREEQTVKPVKPETTLSADNLTELNLSGIDFDDLDSVSEQLRQPLEAVAALDILTPYTGNNNVELTKFAPNAVITRGEYARWLLDANNRYFENDPSKKIYQAAKTSQPAFKDVKPSNPDFAAIQSLAEAGLIPSSLTEDSTKILFKPNAPLTREDLITWKVPLDMRESLPKATIEALEESWGFQDAAQIESSAVRALYGDYQNGDRANVRRIFGYTTLFQPKKPVTRAEAAASLWYFGFQGDGVTAKEILAGESEQQN